MQSDAQMPSIILTGQHLMALLMQLSLQPNLLQLPTDTSFQHQRVLILISYVVKFMVSSLQQPLQHSTVVAVFLYVLLLLYLSLSLSLILILQSQLIVSHFLLTLNRLRMSVLNSSYDSFIGIMGLELSNFNAWNKPWEQEKWGHQFLLWGKVSCCHLYLPSEEAVLGSFDRLFLSQQWWILGIKENSPNIWYVMFGICCQLQAEQLCGSFCYITSQTVHSLYHPPHVVQHIGTDLYSKKHIRSLSTIGRWLWLLVLELSPQMPGFTVGQSVWDLWWTEWHWARFFSWEFWFFPVSIILAMLHTHSCMWHWHIILATVSVMQWSAL